MAEPELVARLRAKDKAALGYLYDHYAGALYGIIYRILQHQAIAEEVLQDVFLKIWDKGENYDPAKGRLFTWMLNVARNQAIDKHRSREMSQSKKTEELTNLVSGIAAAGKTDPQVDSIGLSSVLESLREEQRFVVEYLYLKGYTQSELSEEFQIPLGTVKTRLRMAMAELRKLLNVS